MTMVRVIVAQFRQQPAHAGGSAELRATRLRVAGLLQRLVRRSALHQPVLDLKPAEEPGPRRPLLLTWPPRQLGVQHDPVDVVEPDLYLGRIPALSQLLMELLGNGHHSVAETVALGGMGT